MTDTSLFRLADMPLNFTIDRVDRLVEAFRPLDSFHVTHASLDGTENYSVRREMLRAHKAAIVIPYDPATDQLVVIRQFRIGAAIQTPNAAALELPAGLVDEGESLLQAAGRELTEETGLTASIIAPCFTVMTSPGLCDEVASFFLAIVDASRLNGRAGVMEEQEDILPFAASVDVLLDAADAGNIANGMLFTALQWFARKGRALAQQVATK